MSTIQVSRQICEMCLTFLKSISTFVGNRHLLSERQRSALARIASPPAAPEAREVRDALFYLERQVSNSGRLRALLPDRAKGRSVQVRAKLRPSVDGVLSRMENVVTADAIILDKCGFTRNRGLIEGAVPEARVFRLKSLTF